jgi:Fe-S-cluster containining protein
MLTATDNDALQIRTIGQLKRAIDMLWREIERSCATCTDPDCLGYIWMLPSEEDALLDAGVQTVQVNGTRGPIFIDSYPRDERGNLIVNRSKPRCPYLDENGRCSVHAVRPLVCHLYPLGPEMLANGRAVWALHTDCAHVRSIEQAGGQELLVGQIRRLLKRISPALRREILDVYEKVDAISAFPDGPNNYLIVEEV